MFLCPQKYSVQGGREIINNYNHIILLADLISAEENYPSSDDGVWTEGEIDRERERYHPMNNDFVI